MNRPLVSSLVLTLVLAASQPALACGEGLFNMGGGLRYQGYLAPRPATVLVYDVERAPAADRMTVYRGLVRAGHNLTIAHSPDELAQALRQRRYDVVIAGFNKLDTVTPAMRSPTARLLPVVERSQRNAPEVRGRFDQYLLAGASLGQYLKLINQVMKG